MAIVNQEEIKRMADEVAKVVKESASESAQPNLSIVSSEEGKSPYLHLSDEDLALKIGHMLGNEYALELLPINRSRADLEEVIESIDRWIDYKCFDAWYMLIRNGEKPLDVYDRLNEYCYNQRQYESNCNSDYMPYIDSKGKEVKQKLTADRLKMFLEDHGIGIRFNELNLSYDLDGFNPKFTDQNINANLMSIIYDMLIDSDIMSGVTGVNVDRLVPIVAMQNCFNPVREMIDSATWDGSTDYLQELYEIMGIDPEDELSRILIRKWLHQSLTLALYNNHSNPFGADGCLTLQGDQGIGKTLLLSALAMDNRNLYREGQSLTADKDTKRRCITTWLCELGEVEKTFNKISPEDLKIFITQNFDEYRLPYAKGDTCQPRRASMYATCNSTNFLVDNTGSRRFWVVPITKKMNIEKIAEWKSNNTAKHLWRQIFEQYVSPDQDHNGFRLNDDERKMLDARNSGYTKSIPCEDELRDYLAEIESLPENRIQYKDMTASEIMEIAELCGSLRKYKNTQVGNALIKIGFERLQKRNAEGKKGRYYNFPIRIG